MFNATDAQRKGTLSAPVYLATQLPPPGSQGTAEPRGRRPGAQEPRMHCQTTELHLKPEPNAICHTRSPRRSLRGTAGRLPSGRWAPHWFPFSAMSSSSYQIEAEETLP